MINSSELVKATLNNKRSELCQSIEHQLYEISDSCDYGIIKNDAFPCMGCNFSYLTSLLNEYESTTRLHVLMEGNDILKPNDDHEAVLKILSAGPNYRLPIDIIDGRIVYQYSEEVYQKHVYMYPKAAVTYGFAIKDYMIYNDPSVFCDAAAPDISLIHALRKSDNLELINSAKDPQYVIAVIIEAIRHSNLQQTIQRLREIFDYFDIKHIKKYLTDFPTDYKYFTFKIVHNPEIIASYISRQFIKTRDACKTADHIRSKYCYNLDRKIVKTLKKLE